MQRLRFEDLTPIQQTIVSCARSRPGQLSRSSLAKLLVGSRSARAADLAGSPDYGRLAGHGRKEVTYHIDVLLQQGCLALDNHDNVIVTPGFGD